MHLLSRRNEFHRESMNSARFLEIVIKEILSITSSSRDKDAFVERFLHLCYEKAQRDFHKKYPFQTFRSDDERVIDEMTHATTLLLASYVTMISNNLSEERRKELWKFCENLQYMRPFLN